jgi:hypothetical protein
MEPNTNPPPNEAPGPWFELSNLKLANLVYFCGNAEKSAERPAESPSTSQAGKVPNVSLVEFRAGLANFHENR